VYVVDNVFADIKSHRPFGDKSLIDDVRKCQEITVCQMLLSHGHTVTHTSCQ